MKEKSDLLGEGVAGEPVGVPGYDGCEDIGIYILNGTAFLRVDIGGDLR